MKTSKIWFITGASKGLGKLLTSAAIARGHKVAATARQLSALDDFAKDDRVLRLELDVGNRAQVFSAVNKAAEHFGRLDVVVNNAGYGLFGPIEGVAEAELTAQLDTNLFGPLRVCQAALPHLRKAGGGNILQISSIAGFVGSAGGGPYHASKFALEGMSEALAQEAASFGVKVTIIEPGGFRTDFAGGSIRFTTGEVPEAMKPFASMVKTRLSAFNGNQMGDPAELVRVLLDVTELEDPPLRLLIGEDALMRARGKVEFTGKEFTEFESLSRTRPLPGGAPLSTATMVRPWAKKA